MISQSSTPISLSIQRRLTATLFVVQSIIGAGQILSFTFLPIVATALIGNERWAGVPATLTMLGRALAAYPIGWLMDRLGRRLGLSLGYFISVFGALVCVAAISQNAFWLLCLGAAFNGVSRSSGEQARFAAAEVTTPDRRAKAIGLIVFAGTIGSLGSPFLTDPAGALATSVGLLKTTGPYFITALLALISALLTFVFLRPDPKEVGLALASQQPSPHKARPNGGRPLREIFANQVVILATVVLVVSQLVMTFIMVIAPLHMHHHNHADNNITWALTFHTLGMFGFSSITGWLIDRSSRQLMILIGSFVLAISAVVMPLSPHFIPLALALFLLGLGWNFCFIAGSSLLSDALAPEERGRAQGANEMLVALAAGAGSLTSGSVFAQGDIIAVSAVGLAISLALAMMAGWSLRRRAVIVTG